MRTLRSSGNFEREIPAKQAIGIAKDIATDHGLTIEVRQVGIGLKTSRCELVDSKGFKAAGLGKGVGDQTVISAVFEAFEHYFAAAEDTSHAPVRVLDIAGSDRELHGSSPDFAKICGPHTIPLARLEFTPLGHSGGALLFPTFLLSPDYRPSSVEEREVIESFGLTRYSTNSGTASGLCQSDALLHGLLEVVERDAIGIELLRTVIRRDARPVREIQRYTLPENVAELCVAAEREARGRLSIWDITTDLGIPAVLAALSPNGEEGGRYFGSGASLCSAYAIERAVLESVQSFHGHKIHRMRPPGDGTTAINGMPRYVGCFLDFGTFDYRGGREFIAFSDVSDRIAELPCLQAASQVQYVVQLLHNAGIKAYWRSLVDSRIHVIQVIVPKLERFHLVSHGIFVAPSARGRAAIARA